MKAWAYFENEAAWLAWHTFIQEEKGYPLQPVFADGTPNPKAQPITEYTEGFPSPLDASYAALVFAEDWSGPTMSAEEAAAYFPQDPPPSPPPDFDMDSYLKSELKEAAVSLDISISWSYTKARIIEELKGYPDQMAVYQAVIAAAGE